MGIGPVYRMPTDNRPTEDFPGLRVKAGTQYTRSQGDYVCHCGAEDHANGDVDVKKLVDDYTAHQALHARERDQREPEPEQPPVLEHDELELDL